MSPSGPVTTCHAAPAPFPKQPGRTGKRVKDHSAYRAHLTGAWTMRWCDNPDDNSNDYDMDLRPDGSYEARPSIGIGFGCAFKGKWWVDELGRLAVEEHPADSFVTSTWHVRLNDHEYGVIGGPERSSPAFNGVPIRLVRRIGK